MRPLRLALLGDSIAHGVGAARAADALGPRLAADLAATGLRCELGLFAVSGARSADLAAQVVRAGSWRPDVAVVVVGGNDVTHLVPAAQAAADLGRAVAALHSGGAQVVAVPAPDLSVVAHVPPALRGLVRASSALMRSAQVDAAQRAGVRVAELGAGVSGAFAADPAMFCADRFHPSSVGYAVIAAALAPVVRDAANHAVALVRSA